MVHNQENKYYLRSLHEEIDLFDRKLAHLLKYDAFDSEAARDAAVQKMNAKRAVLVKTAQHLAEKGIEFKETELPRSLRPKDAPVPVRVVEAEPVAAAVPEAGRNSGERRPESAFAGTSLDWEKGVREYMLKKASK